MFIEHGPTGPSGVLPGPSSIGIETTNPMAGFPGPSFFEGLTPGVGLSSQSPLSGESINPIGSPNEVIFSGSERIPEVNPVLPQFRLDKGIPETNFPHDDIAGPVIPFWLTLSPFFFNDTGFPNRQLFEGENTQLPAFITARFNQVVNKDFLDSQPVYNSAGHEVQHVAALLGMERILGIWLPVNSITVRSASKLTSQTDWLGKVSCWLPEDTLKKGQIHPGLLGILASASGLYYQDGVTPQGRSLDNWQTSEARQSIMASSGHSLTDVDFMEFADRAIQEEAGINGHYFLNAMAHLLTPMDGQEIHLNGAQLRLLANEVKKRLEAQHIVGELNLLTLLVGEKSDASEKIAQWLKSELSGSITWIPTQSIWDRGEKHLLVEEEPDVWTCQDCKKKGQVCPHCRLNVWVMPSMERRLSPDGIIFQSLRGIRA